MIEVVVAILVTQTGRFLMTSRPAGKVYELYWEFPGGKVEKGEALETALTREIKEELNIEIHNPRLLTTEAVEYPHASVHLHFFKVCEWTGDITGMEGQNFGFFEFPHGLPSPILPGTLKVLPQLIEMIQ